MKAKAEIMDTCAHCGGAGQVVMNARKQAVLKAMRRLGANESITANALAAQIGANHTTTCNHLRELERSGFVKGAKDGKEYRWKKA